MPDEPVIPSAGDETPAPVADPTPSADADVDKSDKGGDKTVPISRFNEINERMKAAESAVQKNTDDNAAVRTERLKKDGEFEKVATEAADKLAIALEENKEFRAERDAEHADILAKLPEANQEFVKKHGLNLGAIRDYRDQISPNGSALNIKDPPPDFPGGGDGKPKKKLFEMSLEEQKQWLRDKHAANN